MLRKEHGSVTYRPFEEIMTDRPTDRPTNRRTSGFVVIRKVALSKIYAQFENRIKILNGLVEII